MRQKSKSLSTKQPLRPVNRQKNRRRSRCGRLRNRWITLHIDNSDNMDLSTALCFTVRVYANQGIPDNVRHLKDICILANIKRIIFKFWANTRVIYGYSLKGPFKANSTIKVKKFQESVNWNENFRILAHRNLAKNKPPASKLELELRDLISAADVLEKGYRKIAESYKNDFKLPPLVPRTHSLVRKCVNPFAMLREQNHRI